MTRRIPNVFGASLILLLATLLAPGALPARSPKPFFVGFASGGEHVVYASHRGGIAVLTVPELEPVRAIADEEGRWLSSVAVSGNGRWLAGDHHEEGVSVWEVGSGELRLTLPKERPRREAVYLFHPKDDVLYVFRSREGLSRWDVASSRDLGEVRPVLDAERMALSPDGKYLAVSGTCRFGDRRTPLCVWGEDEQLVLAGADPEPLFERPVEDPLEPVDGPVTHLRDLGFADARRLVAVGAGSGVEPRPPSPVVELSPFDLGILARRTIAWDRELDVRGARSAPREQLQAFSADGRWKVTLSTFAERLYLYRVEEGEPGLETFAPLP